MRGFTTELGVGQCVINRTEQAKVLSNEDQVYSQTQSLSGSICKLEPLV